MNCILCSKNTRNPKFCSRSCSAKYNNSLKPKRKLGNVCKTCNEKISTSRKFCKRCWEQRRLCPTVCPIHNVERIRLSNGNTRCKKCSVKVQIRHRRNKVLLLKFLAGNKCQICGYSRCIKSLHFHHLNPQQKLFNISHADNHTLELMRKEASKCILVCANCHGEIHEGVTRTTGIEPAISSSTN